MNATRVVWLGVELREEPLKIGSSLLFMSKYMNNSDGKAGLKQQKSPETTTDTQDMSKFNWFYVYNIHISKCLSL